MELLLFLLLPIAAYSGWLTGRKSSAKKASKYIAGLNYNLHEQPDKTVEALVQMPAIDDDTFETHLTLGSIFRRRGELDRAIRLHQSLIQRPDLATPYKSLALLELARDFIAAGVLDHAEAILLELVAINEQLVPSLQHLLELYQQGKEWLDAIKIAQKLQEIKGVDLRSTIAHFYCELAEQKMKANELDEAKNYLNAALKTNKDFPRALILMEQQSSENSPVVNEQVRQDTKFRCDNCGFMASKLQWLCPSCKQWDRSQPITENNTKG